MKFILKSDPFKYIHPNHPMQYTNVVGDKELDVAINNSQKISYNKTLLLGMNSKAPKSQKGVLLIFPDTDIDKEDLYETLKTTTTEVINTLKGEYYDAYDIFDRWCIDDKGKYFKARFENPLTSEKFNKKSLSIYFCGCKTTTANYIIEEMLDILENIVAQKKNKEIGKIKTVLVYEFENERFCQFGTNEKYLYFRESKNKGIRGVVEYPIPLFAM